jgi:hypothetical protein
VSQGGPLSTFELEEGAVSRFPLNRRMTEHVAQFRLWWDFFGPESAGTATHFARHLREFLVKHELSYEPLVVPQSGATSIQLEVEVVDFERVRAALRPRRIEEVSDASRGQSEEG